MPKNVAPEKLASKVMAKRPAKSVSRMVTTLDAKVAVKSTQHQKTTKKNDTRKAAEKIAKPKKDKVVRDSFTMPESEYELIAAIKRRCIAKGLAVKKSEVLRAAVCTLATRSDALIIKAVKALEIIKTGRPPKGHHK